MGVNENWKEIGKNWKENLDARDEVLWRTPKLRITPTKSEDGLSIRSEDSRLKLSIVIGISESRFFRESVESRSYVDI